MSKRDIAAAAVGGLAAIAITGTRLATSDDPANYMNATNAAGVIAGAAAAAAVKQTEK